MSERGDGGVHVGDAEGNAGEFDVPAELQTESPEQATAREAERRRAGAILQAKREADEQKTAEWRAHIAATPAVSPDLAGAFLPTNADVTEQISPVRVAEIVEDGWLNQGDVASKEAADATQPVKIEGRLKTWLRGLLGRE